MSSDWIRVALLLSEISRSMAWKKKKLASRTFIHVLHVFKAPAIRSFHKDKNEDADDVVFQMICFLNLISFARFCASLIFIFSIIRTLDYPDYFVWSQRVRIIEVRLYCVSPNIIQCSDRLLKHTCCRYMLDFASRFTYDGAN